MLKYPFHPIAKPDSLRTDHLAAMKTPTLFCQGTRDPFGSRDEVAGHKLSEMIDALWLEDGAHNFRSRKAVSGLTAAEHFATVADHLAEWAFGLLRP